MIVGLPDPLRRAKIPEDLDSVTSVGAEVDPTDVGMTEAGVEKIWSAVRKLYKSGVHPAHRPVRPSRGRGGAGPCDRPRQGQRPGRGEEPGQGARYAGDAVLPLLRLEGHHRDPDPSARRARCPAHRRPGRGVPPRVRAQRQGRHHHRPRAVPPRRHPQRTQGFPQPRHHRRLEAPARLHVRREADVTGRQAAGVPRGHRRRRARRGRARDDGQADPARCWPRRSSTRSASAG